MSKDRQNSKRLEARARLFRRCVKRKLKAAQTAVICLAGISLAVANIIQAVSIVLRMVA